MRRARLVVVAPLLLGAACAALAQGNSPLVPGPHEVLRPVGPAADATGQLWNVFLLTCTVVFAAVFAAFLFALMRAHRADDRDPADVSSVGRHEPGPYRSVIVGVVVSAVLLLMLLGASVYTDRAVARLSLANAVREATKIVASSWLKRLVIRTRWMSTSKTVTSYL